MINPSGRLWTVYGSDPYEMTRMLLDAVQPQDFLPRDKPICLKPNLVVSRPAQEGATTHPQIAAAVIAWLRERGYTNLFLAEGSWVGESTVEASRVCGYQTLSRMTGVPFYDLKEDGCVTRTVAGIPIELSRRVADCGFILNLPVLKGHCQTAITCALKNMKGCISDRSKREFHTLGLHKPIAALNTLLPPQLVLADGICGDLDFEEGGNPVFAGRMLASRDPVLLDSYGAMLLGYAPEEIPYLALAQQLGVGSCNVENAVITELNCCDWAEKPAPTRRVRALQKHLREQNACSACYAAAIHALGRLEERGLLQRLGEPLYIGQGYRGQRLDQVGLGSCCKEFSCCLPGCPPTSRDILAFLEKGL